MFNNSMRLCQARLPKIVRNYTFKSTRACYRFLHFQTVRHSAVNVLKALVGQKKTKKSKPNEVCFKIYRYNPETCEPPYMQDYELETKNAGVLVLDALNHIKNEIDPTLVYRRSCREGICGSCAMNINGVNRLACLYPIPTEGCVIYPLPHAFVIRDLVVDMNNFYRHYQEIMPYLRRKGKDEPIRVEAYAQSERDRLKIDGLYECILCSCCSFSCPAYWWHGDEDKYFLGPAALLHAYRWVIDSRDEEQCDRLKRLKNQFRAFRCHTIFNCTSCCPKGLNPGKAIAKLKLMIAELEDKEDPDMPNPTRPKNYKGKAC